MDNILSHFLITQSHCLRRGANHPMSPETAGVGTYFPSPRK